jgi:hypothetical protein
MACEALKSTFPWATDVIAVAVAWLAKKRPQDVAEAEQLARAGRVVLPPFDPCCVDMARMGMITKWLDWERDAAELEASDRPAAEAVPSNPGQHTTTEARRPTTGVQTRDRATLGLPF